MTRTKLYPGLPITLKLNRDGDARNLLCWVETVHEQTVVISAPLEGGTPVLLDVGASVAFTFWDKVCAFTFETTIIGRKNSLVPAYEVHLPDKFSRVQRRDDVRIDASLPIAYQVLNENNSWSDWQNSVALDISGGGIKFLANKAVPPNSSIKLRLHIENGELDVMGLVGRTGLSDLGNGYTVAVQFLQLTRKDREKIIRYIFQIQRMMRKKGLI